MQSNRQRYAATTLIICGFLLAGCSSEDDVAEQVAVTSASPSTLSSKAGPAELPQFWDAQNGGIFTFDAGLGFQATETGILVADLSPSIWSWDGQEKKLTPSFDGADVTAERTFLLLREGNWYLTQLSLVTKKVSADSLGDAKEKSFVTTWNDKGEVVFQGEYTTPEGMRGSSHYWKPLANGTLLHDAGSLSVKFVLDPFTGTGTKGRPPKSDPVAFSNALEITFPGGGADAQVINRRTGATWSFNPVARACDDGKSLEDARVVSSFNGRYVAFGSAVVDTESMQWSCLDPAGSPELTVITSTGIGYGTGTQNEKKVVVSYDFQTRKLVIVQDAILAPALIGPGDQAITETDDGRAVVYRAR